MATIKAVSSKASIKTAVNYVSKYEKTEEKLVSGIGCSPESAANEMQATKNLWQNLLKNMLQIVTQLFIIDLTQKRASI